MFEIHFAVVGFVVVVLVEVDFGVADFVVVDFVAVDFVGDFVVVDFVVVDCVVVDFVVVLLLFHEMSVILIGVPLLRSIKRNDHGSQETNKQIHLLLVEYS